MTNAWGREGSGPIFLGPMPFYNKSFHNWPKVKIVKKVVIFFYIFHTEGIFIIPGAQNLQDQMTMSA